MKKTFPLLLSLAAASACHAATLVGHWKFDETSGTTAADQTGSNAGTIGTGVTVGATGKIGNAYSFNGTTAGNVSMGDATFLSTILETGGSSLNSYTYSVWFNRSTTGSSGSIVFAGDNTLGDKYSNFATSSSSTVRRWLRGSGAGDGSSGSYSLNTWHHIVLSVTPTGSKTYLNGVEIIGLAQTFNYTAIDTANVFTIGLLDRDNKADPFNGLIDDVQVYTGSLSASEVSTLFSNPGATVPEPSALLLSALGSLALLRRKR